MKRVAVVLLAAACRADASGPEADATAGGRAASSAAAPAPDDGRDDFEADRPGALPPGFTAAMTIGDPKLRATLATWVVAEDAAAPSGGRVVKLKESKNREAIYNLLLREQPRLADVALSVMIRPDDGFEDRGGGLVWRVKDAQNYYLCRWNPIEKNLRAYAVVAGKRVQLQSVYVAAEAGTWHSLAVVMRGKVLEISFDGLRRISCADPTFADAGRVGLWTKADARTSFDDLRVEAAAPSP